jgi:hypothetical protein
MSRSTLALVFSLAVAATVGYLGTSAFARTEQASRIIDRTFRCTPVALGAGLRDLDVEAVPIRAREDYNPSQSPSPGFIGVATGSWDAGSELVSIRARGWQRFETTYSAQGVYASIKRCAASRVSLPLSARGLSGPSIQWAEHGTCLVRGRVLVRVRVTLQSPAWWLIDTSFANVGARSNVVVGALAMRSERTGKPIAYMELDRAGKTRLWLSPNCS